MGNEQSIAGQDVRGAHKPVINKIGLADLKDALAKGIADFNAMPTHLVFFCVIYPIVSVIFARTYGGYDLLQYAFPLLAGYTLIGPLVAIGMYELSRRRELGETPSRMRAFDVFKSPSIWSISILGLVLMVVYFAWLFSAQMIYVKYFGTVGPESITAFAFDIFTTDAGLSLITIGSGVGLVFAIVVFSLSVVSFPMLLHRDVGVITAVITSFRAVLANPVAMGLWGLIVAYALLVGSIPFFIGLGIVLPVLGHSTWHLYRRVVEI